ncbi:hypothetical protein BD309DRAFT_945480 [Dichomitus squalens]|nr:hypothetical protein BD309DRAFT_945480 [Dichomitus squalens]
MRCASARTSSTHAAFVARSRLQRPCDSAWWRAGTGPGRTPTDTAKPTRSTDARVAHPLRRIGSLDPLCGWAGRNRLMTHTEKVCH